jgi:hypothetical protein
MLERIANIAVIAGVTLFFALAAKDYLARHNQPVPGKFPDPLAIARSELIGKPLGPVGGLVFPRQRPSILLALSTACHFCKDSEPFYRQLSTRVSGKVDLIALFPQPLPEASAYARDHIPTATVLSGPLESIHVAATPTLILVDRSGKVREVWVGRLNSSREQEVLSRILSIKD